MPQPWNPSPFVKFSLLTHAAAGASLLVVPGSWPWALAAIAANQGALITAGLLPRTTLLGPNLTRLPAAATKRREIALTIDDGPDPEVTPHVLDQLDAAGAKASFFCIGHIARRHPALCREIVARGHRVENHGDSHSSLFAAFGSRRMTADIAAAQATLCDLTGEAPRFFRPTAGLRNPLLDPVLARLGLQLAAWTRRPFDTREGQPQIVFDRLTRQLAAGDILLMHDGHAARTATGEPVILAVLPRLLQTLAEHRLTPVTLASAQP
ncbi:MAG: polysaccharide deacetylase family protein [Betaproteobacteria bacterium HGW-Betaproteobacteria-7]|jgi:peptidoglycan/xylan/chitin deacetylase (PgdA/CDA1 family)|nr:MAG: polysaccharide deacetylase family protein [Betaproteobacteria bacterium HGW-Betaproteobacteria-7]